MTFDALTGPGRWPLQRLVPLAIGLACAGALAAALAGQHVLGLEPCILCLYERWPYVIAGGLAALALVLPPGRGRSALVAVCALVFLGGAGLAFFHVGIEEHWWTSGLPGCSGGDLLGQELTMDAFQKRLQGPPPKPCDEVDWRLFGLSLAGYNVLASLALAAAALVGVRLMERERRQ